jgi:hypothetical protein
LIDVGPPTLPADEVQSAWRMREGRTAVVLGSCLSITVCWTRPVNNIGTSLNRHTYVRLLYMQLSLQSVCLLLSFKAHFVSELYRVLKQQIRQHYFRRTRIAVDWNSIFLLATTFTPPLVLTQSAVQWFRRALSLVIKRPEHWAEHSSLNAEIKNARNFSCVPHAVFDPGGTADYCWLPTLECQWLAHFLLIWKVPVLHLGPEIIYAVWRFRGFRQFL